MFITRMGENTKVLINGDINQTDLYGQSGLDFCMDRLEGVKGVGVSRAELQRYSKKWDFGRVFIGSRSDSGYNNNDDFLNDDGDY